VQNAATAILLSVVLAILFHGTAMAGTQAGSSSTSAGSSAGIGDPSVPPGAAGAPAPGGAGASGETVAPAAPANDNGLANSRIVNNTPMNDNGMALPANDNNGVTTEIDKRLSVHWNDAIKQVNEEGLTRGQEGAIQENPGLRPAAQGTQLDTAFKLRVDADPNLRAAGVATTPRGVFGPDVNGPSGSDASWDATTLKDFASHVSKYGSGVRPLLWFEFRW
jgi:hypothetical protein